MHYTVDDVRHGFDRATFSRGASYFDSGMVQSVALDGDVLKGKVAGSSSDFYQQSITLVQRERQVRFKGDCTCPMDYNCKHVVAVLLAADKAGLNAEADAEEDASPAALPFAMSQWLANVSYLADSARRQHSVGKNLRKNDSRAIYVLKPQADTGRMRVNLYKGKMTADGEIRSATAIPDLENFQHKPPAYLRPEDRPIAAMFSGLMNGLWGGGTLDVAADGVAAFLQSATESGVLYLATDNDALRGRLRQLHAGPTRAGRLAWRAEHQRLHLGWAFEDGTAIDYLLPSTPPGYVAGEFIGQLDLPTDLTVLPLTQWLTLVEQAPELPTAQAASLAEELLAAGLESLLPLPQTTSTLLNGLKPTPVLTLQTNPGTGRDIALLGFDYEGQRVGADPRLQLVRISNSGIDTIERNVQDELAASAALAAAGFMPAPAGGTPGTLYLPSDRAWLDFVNNTVPALRQQGWRIDLLPGFRFDLAGIDDWYANVNDGGEGSANNWLELELGIVVNGAPVPLLPVLLQLIRQAPRDFAPAALDIHGDDEALLAALPDGRRVALPWGRVKPILRTLGELYFTDRVGDTLRMTQLDAARLAELETGAQLRWMGGERLRSLGRKLAAFEQVQPVASPVGLQASLRPYQADGLAWMQFLREYGLAGILADDMGLGKTIQTLSHILVEKEAGRLTTPALVVAPTSLMVNWQAEAARFTPGLRVLALTGKDRLQRFGEMAQADLVLTSYALLPRDEDVLRQQRFHLLILDESQYIKNHRSKAAQTAGLLKASHRLCLTGTPMQNHLGELWAQFHFLMPGLLGEEKTFNTQFRKPIEKQGDNARNAFLIRRIKPFLLRRTKDHVAKELPPKTEMVRMVELAGAQRDLYETVRLAMDKKVRDEIARKGVARSQIVILDALLKLRQVCCDPRLLKTATGRKAEASSAKLHVLLELIEELLSEGRKLLVFSQFTSMLALIEEALRERGVPYALLTGDTTDRAAPVAAFQDGQVPVFLVSLKAGGVGLNLTAADTVIHYDPWWNPAVENQATDRAWRIGQDKPVFVYRLIAAGTLEEKIQQLQRAKAGLADAVLAGGDAQGLQITPEDLLSVLSTGIT
jgi:hypothetical protein